MVDVAVVGAGVMGASTAFALTRRGTSVALIEQFHVGHRRGSSHGSSRIFRLSYPDERYVAMAQEALVLWRQLERDSGEELLTTTGGLDMGKSLSEHAAALTSCGAGFELFDGTEAARRWPYLDLGADAAVLFQADAGIVAADRAVATFARGALGRGATLHDGRRVAAIRVAADHVTLGFGDETLSARVVVVAAGAWARTLLAGAGIELDTRPTRETVAYFRVPASLPPALVDWGSPAIYALASPGHGLKAGEHSAGPTTDPDAEGEPDGRAVERLEAWVGDRFPGAERVAHHAETCLYTNTLDEHFVLERHGRVVVGSPCSGHGFKFAPLIGQRLAALAHEALDG